MRSNKAHRLLALLLAFVMTFSLLPTVTWAANETNGDCSATDGSSSVTWSYDAATTTLTISGKGAMADSADDWPVWGEDITTEVTSLIIKSGVTNVGAYNFYQAASLESVDFPDTLETIKEYAFSECAALSKITFPQGLKKIGVSAFEGCSALTSINLPQGLEVICESAFNGAALKGTVRIPSSVTAIEDAAFGTAKGLTIGLNITPGQSARGEGIKLGYGWSGSATVCYYPDLQKTWAKGTEITIAADGEVFTGTIDLNDFSVKMKREMPVVEEFVLNSPTVTSTLGTINSPASLAIKAYGNGLYYYADTTLTLVPPDGTDGDKIPVDVSFILTKPAPKEYVFEGAGTEANPYKISSLADLRGLQTNVNRFKKTYEGEYFLQTADIDMTGVKSWDQIGTIARNSVSYPFKATYDGGGHKITNWTFDYSKQSDPRYAGLFGNVSVLKNLTLDETCTFKLRSWSGTLAYQVDRIENCFSYATVTAQTTSGDNANASIGGLVKLATNMVDCANYGTITVDGGGTVGGLAATCYNAVNCRNYGTVTASGTKVGGICAELSAFGNSADEERGVISGCANYGTVSAREQAGGLVGELSGIMEDCYNLGTVKVSKTTVGGLVGIAYNTSSYTDKIGVFNSYHAGSVQYGAEEAEPVAGHLIGSLVGRGDNEKVLGSLYYQQVGILPAVGDYDAGDHATGMTLNAMQAPAFVDKLNGYTNISLRGVTWNQGNSESQNLPVCGSFETLKDYACDLTGLTVNGNAALQDKSGDYYFVLPHGTDLTKVTVATTISPRATVKPADGTVDFSNDPVDFTVTAEDGTHSKTYPVTVTAAASANGLTALRLSACNFGEVDATTAGTILLDVNDFQQDKTGYTFDRFDTQVTTNGLGMSPYHKYFIWAVPAETGATMTAAIGDRTQAIAATTDMTADTFKSISYANLLKLGENTLTLTVTPPEGGSGTETVYTFKLTVLPTLKTVTFAEEGLEQNAAFAPETLNYKLGVPSSVKSLTPTVAATLSDGVTVTYSPALENGKIPLDKLDNGKFTITVSDAETGAVKTVYTYTVERIGIYDAQITTNAVGAQVRVYQGDTLVTPGKNGVYSLRTDKTYKYVVVAKGYVTKTGTLSGSADLTDGVLNVTLEAVKPNQRTQYNAQWPNFRGNDQSMAVVSAKTPIGQNDDVEILWSSQTGTGYDTNAVSSPILVGGYMYAYAGTKIVKMNTDTGAIEASGSMVGTSSFGIVPPTYADGMIFVGLSNGRVQAFDATTLESLWLYTDPLGGQPNSPITYSDGCIYTGFWNGEKEDANFVCLTVDDEAPDQPKEAKEAMWRYTGKGGFYWAGAYVNDKYAIVGTDDGSTEGAYVATANLLVFDKNTGKLVDSKTGYVGDIRSNIAYENGRVYFTTKGGHFYSEVIGSDGKIDAAQSKSIALGGMSTSTPVVYNSRAYVGVSGTGQFDQYSGHHIAVLDLTSWTVAYTATTQGYPQTSGLVTTGYGDGVYVYFMDNYTPGVMRVIHDTAGQTKLEGGITENGHANCAPVLFTPQGALAEHCICSPVADEYGTLYFKNDTGSMIALTSAVKELVVAKTPESVDVDGSKVQVTGGKIVAKLANGMERDVTNVVTYHTYNEGAVEAVYTYGTDVGNYTLSTKTVPLPQPKSDIKIGNGTTDGTTVDGVTSFKAGTSADAPEIKVTAPAADWKLGAENTFTVASGNDVACVVLVKKADGTYQKLTATTADGTHSFTATLAADDSIVVALKGDVDGDGVITAAEARKLLGASSGKVTLTDIEKLRSGSTGEPTAAEARKVLGVSSGKTAFDW